MEIKKVSKVDTVESWVEEYSSLQKKKKVIEDRMSLLSNKIKEHAKDKGVKDDKGNYYAECPGFIFGAQVKKSVSFNTDKALNYFKLKGFLDCIQTVEQLDEKTIEKYVNSGDISFSDLESITNTKITYAVSVKNKEEMPVVEQVSVSNSNNIAASKKPSFKRR